MGKNIDPRNIKHEDTIITDLAQVMKKQRDFLKWMSRRYAEVNSDQSAAFRTGAEVLDDIRRDLVDGIFSMPGSEELFISQRELNELYAKEEELDD